ncbi:hypothetical protein BDY19DRAFT_712994 [Irpex rosettiformis]|uniref:Uncharacterized protein n=1 Tax=Irpex rosettiformis TaxID=378272 RepID=A0ACB8U8L3_9APHY|nr:hypothetical protein BDY19DRAFT_712994 [Irpex rosettiformis]
MHAHTVYRDRDAMARSAAAHEKLPRVPKSSEGKSDKASAADKDKDKETTTVITYCLEDHRVYVALAKDLEEAINLAYEVYPELTSIPRSRIQFTISVKVKQGSAQVVVSRTAWTYVAAQMRQFEIIYVHVLPEDTPVPRSPGPSEVLKDLSSTSPRTINNPRDRGLPVRTRGLRRRIPSYTRNRRVLPRGLAIESRGGSRAISSLEC